MRAELHPPDRPEDVLAVATWDGRNAYLEPASGAPEGVETILRPTPVVVEDAALRRQGTHGESVLQPGDVEWFRAALLTRAPALGLAVRFVTSAPEGGGWDPAGLYRTFDDQVERLTSAV